MANAQVSGNDIKVHYQGSFVLEYKCFDDDDTQVDASDWDLWFIVDGIPVREKLVANPDDPLGQMVKLETTQIEELKLTACPWIIRDETDLAAGEPIVLEEGTISAYGFKGAADTEVG